MGEDNKIVIIGIGNLLLMDEGVGIHVIDELGRHELPKNVKVFDGGTGGFKLIDLMAGAKKVIFIDAVETGQPPGTITVFKSDNARANYRKKRYSLHDTDLLEVLKIAELLESSPEIEVVGVQPKRINYGTTLSQELKESIPETVSTVLRKIEEMCGTLS